MYMIQFNDIEHDGDWRKLTSKKASTEQIRHGLSAVFWGERIALDGASGYRKSSDEICKVWQLCPTSCRTAPQ